MKKTIFTGTCTAMVTPFLNGKINFPLLEVLIQRQLDAGIRTIVLSGTTGESATLSDAEKTDMIRFVKRCFADACQIIAGTGSNDTHHALKLSLEAQEAGADALLVVSPYYNKANTQGLIQHYLSIATNVTIPIILYNVPSRTGVDIPVSVYHTLSKIPNIAGVKEATTNISKIVDILAVCGNQFPIWSGNDDMTIPIISLGGKGVISVASNVAPQKIQDMTLAALDGDFDTAGSIQIELQPLIRMLFSDVNPVPVKEAMKYCGFDCGNCRLPLSIDEETQKRIKDFFV